MKPWLVLPTQLAHAAAPIALELLAAFREPTVYTWSPFSWRGMNFANRLGIAGGVDKDAEQIEAWWKFGPGFLEVGTVTPKPQGPNPGRIMSRDIDNRALWNRMGFPGGGVALAQQNLKDLPRDRLTPVFVNIGRNRTTQNQDAVRDYAECIEQLSGLADAFVINISSPNTAGLRDLLQPQNLKRFLGGVLAARNKTQYATPLLLKISPDLTEADLANVVEQSVLLGVDGFIATNTTLARYPGAPFPAEGGVSGAPLAHASKHTLSLLLQQLGSSRRDKLVVSAGGVMTAEDVFERIEMGADLVQVYTALVYEGPGFFKRVARSALG